MDIAYAKLDLNAKIIEYNKIFTTLLHLQNKSILNRYFAYVLSISKNELTNHLNKLGLGEQTSLVLFCNIAIPIQAEPNKHALLILYSLINRQDDYFTVKMVNWLNWIHGNANSMENSYIMMSQFNTNTVKTKFKHISDSACYKAFYPLVTHIPHKFHAHVLQTSLFEIFRIFIKQRDDNAKYSRCYGRNLESRIKTNLKKEYSLTNVKLADLIKNDYLLNINFDGQICVPNTSLINNIMLTINQDDLLTSIMNKMPLDILK
ncbi:MAG: hypothetical protein QG673_940 [Pseudomonadota bacterium]|nr:hypothetical protein [Pseudomonadota bacterium]